MKHAKRDKNGRFTPKECESCRILSHSVFKLEEQRNSLKEQIAELEKLRRGDLADHAAEELAWAHERATLGDLELFLFVALTVTLIGLCGMGAHWQECSLWDSIKSLLLGGWMR